MGIYNTKHTNIPNLFEYKNKAGKGKKIYIILSVGFGIIIITILLFLLFNNILKPSADKPQPTAAEVAKEVSDLKVLTNSVDSTAKADEYLGKIDELMQQTTDQKQRYDLLSTKAKLLTNSDRRQEAAQVYDEMLAMPDWSEKQRFYILRSAAEIYSYYLDDPAQFRKYVELLQNNGALSEIPSHEFQIEWFLEELETQENGETHAH
jgi:hypothetical protein